MDEPLAAQILIGSTWTTMRALVSDGATITGGRGREAGSADTSFCRLTLRSEDGDLGSKNPRSPYRGKLGPNTPMRAIVPDTGHLWIPGSGWANTADHASLDTVDLDIRADIQHIHWESSIEIAQKYFTTADQRSWIFYVADDRHLVLRWSPDGTFASIIEARSTEPVSVPGDRRLTLRATLDVVNGAGTLRLATFYTGPSVTGPWTQLGAVVTGPITSIYSGTAPVQLGVSGAGDVDPMLGRILAFQMRSTIGGTVVANPDFTAQTAGTTSFVDSAGRTWTLSGAAELRDYDVRFTGEIAQWPTRWNVSGKSITAPIEASGLRRRLGRPKAPLRSPLYREATKAPSVALMTGYWPMEDGAATREVGSGIGGPPMKVAGSPTFAAGTMFPGSAALPTLTGSGGFRALLPVHTATGVIAHRSLWDVPAGGWANDSQLVEVRATGTIRRWLLRTNTAGILKLQGLDSQGDVAVETGLIGFAINGKRQMIGFQVTQSGGDIYWQIFTRAVTADLTVIELGGDGTFASNTVGRATELALAPQGGLADGTVGHAMIGTSVDLATGLDRALVGNNGETAGRRIQRLCLEQGVPFRAYGRLDDTAPMGPQPVGKFLDLLDECVDADGGLLLEPRDALCLEYRTMGSIYNQRSAAVLTYGLAGESPHLDPDELADDVVNDYTAGRRGGGSARFTDTTSRLSVNDWPDGVGLADQGDEYAVEDDTQLPGIASWAVHLGTWDEYRYPTVEIKLHRLQEAGKTALAAQISRMSLADLLVINSPPPWLPPEPIEVLAQGWVEEIRPGVRKINFNTSPGRPWQIGVVGVDIVDTDGSELASGISASATSLSVAVTGPLWATGLTVDERFLAWVDDEVVRVDQISGASSPQTFTVTRGWHGLALTHDAGAQVRAYKPIRPAR